MDILTAAQAVTPSTPMSDAGFSSRPSLDVPPSSPSPGPPTAFRVLAKFKRSHSSLNTNDSDPNHSSSTLANQKVVKHKRSVLRRNPASRERPPSISSSASPRSSSMRSAATATESISSRPDTVRQSVPSIVETESSVAGRSNLRLSRMTSYSGISATTERDDSFPGNLAPESRERKRDRDSKSSGNGCLVQ
ncbi:hypothetical protein QCA50_009094 [Cerrena zonata]|uniref:Uncharacterized protein n=1 Tax=Cerrena zonata TaxID=2478898 RepID=A0AAW0G9Q9_9APHY